MSVWEALDEALEAQSPDEVSSALNYLQGQLSEFLEQVNDYDEWESMRETATHDENGTHYSSEPGFSLAKLRKMLGYEEEK